MRDMEKEVIPIENPHDPTLFYSPTPGGWYKAALDWRLYAQGRFPRGVIVGALSVFVPTFLFTVLACAGPPTMPPIPDRTEPPPPSPLANALELAAQRPNSMRAMIAFEPQLEAIAEPIFEIRAYPDGPVSTSNMHPPPSVYVTLLPRRDDVLRSAMLRMEFTTSGRGGIPERNAWLVASPSLLEEPVNWGDSSQPVLQMIPFDVVLPFPALQITDYGPNNRFHRQPTSGLIELADMIRLTAPLYLQLIVEAREENWLGFVATHAYGLIPGGE